MSRCVKIYGILLNIQSLNNYEYSESLLLSSRDNPPTPADSKGSASEKRVQDHKTFNSITMWQQFWLLLAVEGTFWAFTGMLFQCGRTATM